MPLKKLTPPIIIKKSSDKKSLLPSRAKKIKPIEQKDSTIEENSESVFVSTPQNLGEVFYHLRTIKNLQITGACTQLQELPKKMLSIYALKDLDEVTRNENFIEAGSATTLGKLLQQGKSKLPEILCEAITSIATPQIRNLATLGGNICANPVKGTLYAPLLALDAILVLQKENESINLPITKFSGKTLPYLLTKVRIPTEEWEYYDFKRIGNTQKLSENSNSYAFLAKEENNVLTKVRIAFSGATAFRLTTIENRLAGSRIPLSESTVNAILIDSELEIEKNLADNKFKESLKTEFIRLLIYSLKKIS